MKWNLNINLIVPYTKIMVQIPIRKMDIPNINSRYPNQKYIYHITVPDILAKVAKIDIPYLITSSLSYKTYHDRGESIQKNTIIKILC